MTIQFYEIQIIFESGLKMNINKMNTLFLTNFIICGLVYPSQQHWQDLINGHSGLCIKEQIIGGIPDSFKGNFDCHIQRLQYLTRDRKYTDKLPSGVELFFRPIGLITIQGTNKSDIDLYMSFRAGDSLGFNFTFLSFEMGQKPDHSNNRELLN